jgi:transcription elongation factor Elf1
MREYHPLSSAHDLAMDHPSCPGCRRSRMVLCAVEPGSSGFDTRTFECQKCGHVHTMTVSRDPMAGSPSY